MQIFHTPNVVLRSRLQWTLRNPGQPANGVVMENLAQNGIGQRETLIAAAFEFDGLASGKELPIARISIVPARQRLLRIVVRHHPEVGRIKDAVLVLDQEGPHLVPRLNHQTQAAHRCIDGKVWVTAQVSVDLVTIVSMLPRWAQPPEGLDSW